MSANLSAMLYLAASICFIMALRGLSSPLTARGGNLYGVTGMVIAIGTTLASPGVLSYPEILAGIAVGGAIGTFVALRIHMTALPQLVAAFHSLVGLAAVCVASAAFYAPSAYGIGEAGAIHGQSLIEMSLGTSIGAVTFTGSIIAFGKLQGLITGKPLIFPGQHVLNAALGAALAASIVWFFMDQAPLQFWLIVGLSLLLGLLLILPIGGADMPVVISMLNSYSGWAACGIGFTLANSLLIITGALVGSSGAILSYIMCKGMNRSIFNVILGGFGTESGTVAASGHADKAVKSGSADDAAFILKNASSVIIVPGYGMAVAQDGRCIEKGRRHRALCHPSGGGTHAGPHERAAGGSERAL
jgi:NAD(P) transhydrogenase subunit beta